MTTEVSMAFVYTVRQACRLIHEANEEVQRVEVRLTSDALPLIDLPALLAVRKLDGVPVVFPEEPAEVPIPRSIQVRAVSARASCDQWLTAECYRDAVTVGVWAP